MRPKLACFQSVLISIESVVRFSCGPVRHVLEHAAGHVSRHVPKHVLKHLPARNVPKQMVRHVLEHVPQNRLLEPPL